MAVLRVDDLADPHNHGDDHITDEKMAAGSAGVTTGGKAICRQGDASNYGNTLTGGSATVSAG